MSGDTREVARAEPLEVTEHVDESDGEYVRFETTVHPAPDAEAPYVDLEHERFLIDNPDEHVHPHQQEVIEVLEGEYAVALEGTEHRLTEGEEITVPKGSPHRHWNPTNRPIRVAHEHHPARDSADHVAAMYALAQAGKTNEKGIPTLLQFAVINRAYPGIAYTTAIPIAVQKALFAVLAPIGLVAGYDAAYSREE